jgi:hypothetical protein
MENAIEYVRQHLPREELLCQMAEECAELGKAALKLTRIYRGVNPTPVTRAEAFQNLLEEIADVTLCVEVLGLNTPELLENCGRIWEEKSVRWMTRLKERESDGSEGISKSAETP